MITLAAIVNGLIVLAFSAFLGWRGYQRGVLRILQRLISVLSGYVACYFFTDPLAGFFKTTLSLTLFSAYLVSAMLLLCGVSFVVGFLLSRVITQNEDESEEGEIVGEAQEETERVQQPALNAGMIVGVFLGCFLGLITVWLAGISMDAIMLNKQGPAALALRKTDPVRKAAGDMVGGVVAYAVEQKTGHESLAPDLASTLIADPVAVSQQIVEVSKSEEMKQFFSDPSVKLLMQDNKIDELQHHEAFQKLMNTPQTKVFFGVLGSSVKDGETMTQQSRAAHLLTDMYQKARRVKTDPRFVALSEKPEFKQLMQNPSPASIMTNPALKELGDIIFTSPPPALESVNVDKPIKEGSDQSFQSVEKPQWEKIDGSPEKLPASAAADTLTPATDANLIYRWTDEQGHKHFSQTRPEGNYPLEIIKSESPVR